MGNISPHLDTRLDTRISCHCGCGFGSEPDHLDRELAWVLERIRWEVGQEVGHEVALQVHSWARCKAHNTSIKNAHPLSRHQGRPPTDMATGLISQSQACDFHVPGVAHYIVHRIVSRWHEGGLGLYDWGLHVDVGNKSRWDYREKK